jgi:hypothetical protein
MFRSDPVGDRKPKVKHLMQVCKCTFISLGYELVPLEGWGGKNVEGKGRKRKIKKSVKNEGAVHANREKIEVSIDVGGRGTLRKGMVAYCLLDSIVVTEI